jgi:hypothetical protein
LKLAATAAGRLFRNKYMKVGRLIIEQKIYNIYFGFYKCLVAPGIAAINKNFQPLGWLNIVLGSYKNGEGRKDNEEIKLSHGYGFCKKWRCQITAFAGKYMLKERQITVSRIQQQRKSIPCNKG